MIIEKLQCSPGLICVGTKRKANEPRKTVAKRANCPKSQKKQAPKKRKAPKVPKKKTPKQRKTNF